MSSLSLILRNLKYYRKAYLTILAGTVISTAVLTGALVVGDSVRYSLEQLTDIRLGKTRFAIQAGNRFFRQHLADEMSLQTKNPVAPVLQLEGIAINNDQNSRINRVDVLGIDERFTKFWDTQIPYLAEDEAILSYTTAEKLKLKQGDEFLLKLHKQARASENAPFVSEKEPVVSLRLKVASIADDLEMGRFSLKSNQAAPFNVFVSLPAIARKVELEGYANVMLIAGNEAGNITSQKLDSLLRDNWQPEDAGLEFISLHESGLFEIRSGLIFIDDNTAKVIKKAIPGTEPVLTYLVNDISSNGKSTPYSFITATDLKDWQLSEKEIIINDWLAEDLSVKSGDSLQLKYFRMGALRKLTEDSARFCIKAVVPISDSVFDRRLMPDFPGMSDAGNCRDWETGAPVNLDKVRDKDEQYWNRYRGTPKAFIPYKTGQKLWDNAFGHATAYRFMADSSDLQIFKARVMTLMLPAENGLRVQDIYTEGKAAAANSTDFGGLFLSLSFFIIVAALLLTALLFSLLAQTRMSETAILATLGFRKKEILRILLIEASLVVLTGSILGMVCGIFYNKLLLLGLNTLWQDAVRTSMLHMRLLPGTLFAGFAAGMLTALVTLLFIMIRNLRNPLSELVKGVGFRSRKKTRRSQNISAAVAALSFASAGILIISSFSGSENDSSTNFLSAGGLILLAGISSVYALLLHVVKKTRNQVPGFFTLAVRNAGMKRHRTITAIALLAIGTFSVIITGANRKSFYGTENSPQSGTGGFLFWAESTVPVLNDLNTPEGKEYYGLSDETILQNTLFIQMLSIDGNDASCLNLNQVSQPKILGIAPQFFDQKQAFQFVTLDKSISDKHPWLALEKPLAPGIIPAFADQSVITWGLRKKVGDTLLYTDENGKILKVKIIGGLDNSVFQGNVLISAELLRHYFPSTGGSKVMLIDDEFAKRTAISERMEYLFQDYGMVVTPASEKLAQFNSVENTYLSVFMLLGGLGVLLGTFGLGIIVLRNIRDRQAEISLLLAIGLRRKFVLHLLESEYLVTLLSGIFIGTLAAGIGILPTIILRPASLPLGFLAVILSAIVLNGFLWIFFPVKIALNKSLIQSLRAE